MKWIKGIRKFIIGYRKSDMYICEPFKSSNKGIIPEDLLFSGIEVTKSEAEKFDFGNYYISDITKNRGVFGYDSGRGYRLGYKGFEYWFDQSYQFDKLLNISNKLGYKLGKCVVTNKGNSGKIEEIVRFSFYYTKGRVCLETLTLLYKVGRIYYQINQLELLNGENFENIVDESIKEHFYDLLDYDIVSYLSTESDINVYDCKLIINKFSTDILHKVTEYLLVADNRLKSLGISTDIKDISRIDGKYTIKFTCRR
jgi:hypothetical protein